jgi:hypothetical protein
MPESLFVNTSGKQLDQVHAAATLFESFRKDFEDLGQNHNGRVIQADDKDLYVIDLPNCTASVWMEQNKDIMVHICPPGIRAAFAPMSERGPQEFHEELRRIGNQLGLLVGRVTQEQKVCKALLEFYSHYQQDALLAANPRYKMRAIAHDYDRKGMDLFQIRLVRLYSRGGWDDRVKDLVITFDRLIGKQIPDLE